MFVFVLWLKSMIPNADHAAFQNQTLQAVGAIRVVHADVGEGRGVDGGGRSGGRGRLQPLSDGRETQQQSYHSFVSCSLIALICGCCLLVSRDE